MYSDPDVMVQNLVALCFFFIIIFVQRFPGSHKTGESEWATPSWSAWEGQKEETMKRRKRVRKKKKNCSRGMQSERWFSHGCMYRRRVHKKLLSPSVLRYVKERILLIMGIAVFIRFIFSSLFNLNTNINYNVKLAVGDTRFYCWDRSL